MKKPAREYIYGLHSVTAVLNARPHTILELWMLSGRRDEPFRQLHALAGTFSIVVHEVDREHLDRMVKENHQGVIAAVREVSAWKEQDLPAIVESAGKNLLLLILDGVQDPHNLGACLRTANAAGAHAVIVPKDKSVGLTPTVYKVASGAVETTPFIQVTNLGRVLQGLKEQGVWIAGFTDRGQTDLYATDLRGALALVLGAEGRGLRHLTLELCDHVLRIPMQGSVESLNVSVAAGICLYEAVRQRM